MKGTLLGLLLAAVVATTVTVSSGPTGPSIRPAAAFGGLSPQGGTITGITTAGTSGLIGGCTSGVCSLSLPQTCSNGQVETWNSGTTSWGCGSVAINSAGNNVVAKSNGTNLVGSSISDNGTTVSITEPVNVTSQYTWVNRQVLPAASGTYTPTAGTRGAIVRMCGAGGGGGGSATAAATSASAGAGGGAGAYIEFRIGFANSTIATATYTNGTAGTAGAAGANAGGTGGDDTFVYNSGTYTAKGATGGAASAATSAELILGGKPQAGTGCSGTCVSIDVTNGNAGGYAWYGGSANFANPVSGAGGSGPFGAGGASATGSSVAGSAGVGNCSGGSGAATGNNGTQQAGGAGTGGLIVVDEFI